MLATYVLRGSALERVDVPTGGSVPAEAIWFDLLSPTAEEDRAVEAVLGVSIPSREEMAEIEPSSGSMWRTARFDGVAALRIRFGPATTRVVHSSAGKLVTVRYEEPRPFVRLSQKIAGLPADDHRRRRVDRSARQHHRSRRGCARA
jgi:magnesium transporter